MLYSWEVVDADGKKYVELRFNNGAVQHIPVDAILEQTKQNEPKPDLPQDGEHF